MTKSVFEIKLNGYLGETAETGKSLFVPEGVSSISESAFSGCNLLENVYIPETVKRIHKHALANCSNLKEVEFSSSNVYIEAGAFEGCNSFDTIVCENNMRRLMLENSRCERMTISNEVIISEPVLFDMGNEEIVRINNETKEVIMKYPENGVTETWTLPPHSSMVQYSDYSFLGDVQLSELPLPRPIEESIEKLIKKHFDHFMIVMYPDRTYYYTPRKGHVCLDLEFKLPNKL